MNGACRETLLLQGVPEIHFFSFTDLACAAAPLSRLYFARST